MGVHAGVEPTWASQTDVGRTHIATKGVVQSGLVLNLDAGASSSYPGSGTTWTDLTGNSNTGTLTNGPTYSSSNGGSIVFDGTDDYVSFSSTTQSLGLTSSNGATLSCWLKLTLLSRWTGVFTFWGPAGNIDFGWDISPSNVLRIWKNGTAVETSSLSAYSNVWCNYVLVSNSTGTIFYINGTQFTTTSTSGNVSFTNGRVLWFGDHWDNPIQGSSSNIQVHNRALTAAEIQQNFNATRGRYGI